MIDNNTQKELRQRYNPEGSSMRNSQMATFEVLKYIKKICEEENITYWISSGTLLGAVRHAGFIPWDDDVDIEIPVQELKKLKRKVIIDNLFDWHDNDTDPHYWQRFPKIRSRKYTFCENAQYTDAQKYNGCFVDVFPVEKMPDCFVKPCAYLLTSPLEWHNSRSRYKLFAANCIFRFQQNILVPLFRLFTLFSPYSYFHHTYGVYFPKRRYITDSFDTVDVEFENVKFKAPKEYNKYLEVLYGESFMELPDESIRTNHS